MCNNQNQRAIVRTYTSDSFLLLSFRVTARVNVKPRTYNNNTRVNNLPGKFCCWRIFILAVLSLSYGDKVRLLCQLRNWTSFSLSPKVIFTPAVTKSFQREKIWRERKFHGCFCRGILLFPLTSVNSNSSICSLCLHQFPFLFVCVQFCLY